MYVCGAAANIKSQAPNHDAKQNDVETFSDVAAAVVVWTI